MDKMDENTIQHIASYLDIQDVANFRLTCKLYRNIISPLPANWNSARRCIKKFSAHIQHRIISSLLNSGELQKKIFELIIDFHKYNNYWHETNISSDVMDTSNKEVCHILDIIKYYYLANGSFGNNRDYIVSIIHEYHDSLMIRKVFPIDNEVDRIIFIDYKCNWVNIGGVICESDGSMTVCPIVCLEDKQVLRYFKI